jgi:glycosyltransferase involved in cell wall biosynthesis
LDQREPTSKVNLKPRDKFIFVVTHIFPYPPVQGDELRIVKLVKWLHNEGYKVVLLLSRELEEQDHSKEFSTWVHAIYGVQPALRTKLGRRLPRLRRLIWENLKPVLAPLRPSFDVTDVQFYEPVPEPWGDEAKKKGVSSQKLAPLVARLERKYKPVAVIAEYIFLTDCFALLEQDTLKIIDTIDVCSLKETQVIEYGIDAPWTCTRAEERAYLLRCDVVLAIQNREASVFKKIVPEREVLTVGIDFDVHHSNSNGSVPSNTITFVGSGNPLNVHGLRSFFRECWPEIKTLHPEAILNVVGKVGTECQVEDASVNYFPRVEDLSDLYRKSRVVINPTIAGTGLKVKSVEALAHGKPLVAWPHGVEGLEYSGDAPYIKCESWTEFAAAVIRVLQSESAARTLGERALAFAKAKFDSETVYAPLRDRLQAHQLRLR